jgi:hypothetical protein
MVSRHCCANAMIRQASSMLGSRLDFSSNPCVCNPAMNSVGENDGDGCGSLPSPAPPPLQIPRRAGYEPTSEFGRLVCVLDKWLPPGCD